MAAGRTQPITNTNQLRQAFGGRLSLERPVMFDPSRITLPAIERVIKTDKPLVKMDTVGKGTGPSKISELAVQHNRWAVGGMTVFEERMSEFKKHPTFLASSYFWDAVQAYSWYQHGYYDNLLTIMPAVFWTSTFMTNGIVPLITGYAYIPAFSYYIFSTLATYVRSSKQSSMTLGDLMNKESLIKALGCGSYQIATNESYMIGLGCKQDEGFQITGTSSGGQRESEGHSLVMGNAWRAAINFGCAAFGMAFLYSAGECWDIIPGIEKACYLFNSVFPLIEGMLRVNSARRHWASYDNPRCTTRKFNADGTYALKFKVEDAEGNYVEDEQQVTKTGDDYSVDRIFMDPVGVPVQKTFTTGDEDFAVNDDGSIPIASSNVNLTNLGDGPYRFFWDYGDGNGYKEVRLIRRGGLRNFASDLWTWVKSDIKGLFEKRKE